MINVALLEADRELDGICFSVLNNAVDIKVTHRFFNFQSFQNLLPEMITQIVVLDITLPGINILSLISASKKIRPDIDFIISSAWVQYDWVYQCLCAGASGYVNKFVVKQQLLKTINEIYFGQAQMSLQMAQLIRDEHALQSGSIFTQIQSQIIKLFANGFSHSNVSEALNKTNVEVQFQIRNIYNVLHHSTVSA